MEDEDDTESDTQNPIQPETPTTDTTPETSGQQGEPARTFTQAELDRIVADRIKRAENSATSKLLGELGVEDAAKAKALLDAEKARKEEEMSEIEKLQAQLAEKEAAIETANAAVEAAKQQRITDQRNAALRKAIAAANPVDEDAVFSLILTGDLTGVVDQEGGINEDAIKTVVEGLKTSKPTLFIAPTGGSPSNRGGTNPQPNAERKKSIQEQMRKKHGG